MVTVYPPVFRGPSGRLQRLRAARRRQSSGDVSPKLAAIRAAAQHDYPTADIDEMNEEIERGYLGDSGS